MTFTLLHPFHSCLRFGESFSSKDRSSLSKSPAFFSQSEHMCLCCCKNGRKRNLQIFFCAHFRCVRTQEYLCNIVVFTSASERFSFVRSPLLTPQFVSSKRRCFAPERFAGLHPHVTRPRSLFFASPALLREHLSASSAPL